MPSTINADNGVSSGSAGLKSTADSSGVLSLQTNGTTAVTVDTSQNVGIGTTSPVAPLTLGNNKVFAWPNAAGGYNGSTTGTQLLKFTDNNLYIDNLDASTNIIFRRNGPTESMRIDSSGNVGIGTTSPNTKFAINGGGIIAQADGDYFGGGATFYNGGWRNIVASQGGWAVRNTSGVFTIWTGSSPGAAGSVISDFSERARITSGGNLLVGTSAALTSLAGAVIQIAQSAADYSFAADSTSSTAANCYGVYIRYPNASPNGTANSFYTGRDSTATRFEVRSNGGIANYQANNVNLSDRREKTNFAPAKSYLDAICAIPVQTFNYVDQNLKDDPGLTLGVVAQDVQAVAPELVHESNWGTKDNPKMRLSIYQTDLQYALMKCIQELKAEVDSLKSQLAAKG